LFFVVGFIHAKLRQMRHTLIFLLLLAAPLAADKKKPMGMIYRKPMQKTEIAGAPASLATAHRKCENYAWAAIVESMARAQQVNISQDDWALRTSGGEKCFPSLDDYAVRAQAVSGDYTLDAGRKVRIHADYVPGPTPSGEMLNSLRLNRPLMLIWNGRPYLLYGIIYDELIHSSLKAHDFQVREFHLLDAALPASDPKRLVVVKRETDDTDSPIAGISGVMSITVEARNFYDIPMK
jgi:hypothetical protein